MIFKIVISIVLAVLLIRYIDRRLQPKHDPTLGGRLVPRPGPYSVYSSLDRALTREAALAAREARWDAEDAAYRRDLEKRRRLHRMNNPELYE